MEEGENDSVKAVRQFGIVAWAFVAHLPVETQAELVEASEHLHAAFERDVRVLPAPDHEQFAMDVFGGFERIVVHAFAEAALMDVGSVETGGAENIGVHGGAEGKVTADADAKGAELAGAVGACTKMIEDCACVGVVERQLLRGLERVAPVRACLVVGKDGAGGFEFVINLGHGDDVAVAGQQGGRAPDGRSDLEDLGVEDDAGVASGSRGADDVRPHGAVGGVECDKFVVDDDHGIFPLLTELLWATTPTIVRLDSVHSAGNHHRRYRCDVRRLCWCRIPPKQRRPRRFALGRRGDL